MARTKKAKRKPLATATNADMPWLVVVGARQNNLRGIDVRIPLGRFVCVTGVSGSGKSSLVNDIIRETLARDLNGAAKARSGAHDRIEGAEHLDKVIDIDQSPIGRTPRSNPATYIKVFDEIRALFAKLPDSKVRGYKPGRFSFNVATGPAGGGRCEACEGNGSNRMEMDFLADVWVTCPVCNGRRFNRETMQVRYKGKCIADVLEMDVQEALGHFENVPRIAGMLRTLHDVGLDYIKLGQSSTTLSGGEAQRIKLARELVKKSTGRTLYLLDEPTTGLHFDDIKKLLAVLHGFVDAGNTVVVIEHNMDVIKTADWIIDLGPEGGVAGGRIVAEGTPEQVSRVRRSHTGRTLRAVLNGTVQQIAGVSLHGKKGSDGDLAKSAMRRIGRSARRTSREVIRVVGAKQHNLKDITVEVPRGKMTVCCGPSGSGKSSFAVDTVYTEGQRRYVESLSAYARQFLSQMTPPRVDRIDGLSPSICIEQRGASRSPRSTVGTVTEIYDYMRILWARIGQPFCPKCAVPVGTQTSEEIVERVRALGEGTKVLLLAPIEPAAQESYERLFERERRNGFQRVRVDGQVRSLSDPIEIDSRRRHAVELVVDRIVLRRSPSSRLADSVEQALSVGNGVMIAHVVEAGPGQPSVPPGTDLRFSQHRSCERCGESFEELTPHHFSFNSRLGWCGACEGLGVQQGAAPVSIVVHPTRSLADGAIGGWGPLKPGSLLRALADALARHIGFSLDQPWNSLSEPRRMKFLQGCGDDWMKADFRDTSDPAGGAAPDDTRRRLRFRWRGFFPAIDRATRSSWQYRKALEELVTEVPCEACGGGRLRADAAAVRVEGRTIHDVSASLLGSALRWFDTIKLDARQRRIAGELLHEIRSRLRFLVDVGLEYLTLHRCAATLSGGESQRIQLASQIGTGLTGVLYVLDEPTIGLHPRDNATLIGALRRLCDLGNTLLLVEHDREVIDSADHVLDFGPGAGSEGGTVTAAASPRRIRSQRASLTGRYLSHKAAIAVPANRRPVPPPVSSVGSDLRENMDTEYDEDGEEIPVLAAQAGGAGRGSRKARSGAASRQDVRWLWVYGAREHNLKEIDAAFPLGRFICVTGVSGSGKSTLVSSILYRALAQRIHRARLVPGGHDRIQGVEHIDKVINVDQSPIGNSPMSTAATYTGVFDLIRDLFAALTLSKVRGYTANRFSFNRPGGRCEACEGMGRRCIEMHFLPDVWIECESCKGSRFVPETLEVRYRGKSVADVLKMRVREALALFENVPKVRKLLKTLDDVGLGYLELGQPAPTLSAGEAQRVKLAAELGRPSTGKTLYLLDEPTTGLHFDDISKLLNVVHRLVDLGNTCICIEHNLDVIKTADWIIDLGPEAADEGGAIVVQAPPDAVAACPRSHTGRALRDVLAAGPVQPRRVYDPSREGEFEPGHAPRRSLDHQEAALPWERDGKAWHTVAPTDANGDAVEWDPRVLLWLVETIEKSGAFAPTDWNHRSRVEITAAQGKLWFAHFLTKSRDLLEVALRVESGNFSLGALRASLGVSTLDERTDLPIYGQWARVRVRPVHDGWDEIRLFLRDFLDVRKAVFRTFLKKAASSYLRKLRAADADPALAEPWKFEGMKWHLSQKSINRRHVIAWKPELLLSLVGRFRALEPQLAVRWDSRTAVKLEIPGDARYAAKIVTNLGYGLRVEIRTPRGSSTPTQVDRLGREVQIVTRPREDWITFQVRTMQDIDLEQLRAAWRRARTGIDEGSLRSA